jgi:hypothetical protein
MRFAAFLLGAALFGRAAAGDFVGLDPAAALPQPARQGVARIHAQALREHIAWLAAPEREGRGAGSRGLAAATEYVAAQLRSAGIRPMPGAAPVQPMSALLHAAPLRQVREAGGSITLFLPGSAETARAGVAAVLPHTLPTTIEAPLVFAGFGIREPALEHDDFASLDVRGRIVVFVGDLPRQPQWQTAELHSRYAAPRPDDRYEYRLDLLEQLGALAAVAIEPNLPARLRDGREPLEAYLLPAADAPPSAVLPLARLTPDAARHVLALARFDPARPRQYRALPGGSSRARIDVTGTVHPVIASTLIGYLPGSDPKLRAEAVMLGAHLDHLGMHRGRLHPGADDNASGVAALIEMAHAFGAGPRRPRRSLVFAFWAAEEPGQLDSAHYARNPLWPIDRTTAYINLDMIAHPWSRAEIEQLVRTRSPPGAAQFLAQATPENFAETGLAEAAPWLGAALANAARGTGMTLHLDRTDGRNGGSDYRAFARQGVPFIRFFGNFFPGYHEPEDTLENLDPAQVQRMARLVFATAWLIADAPPAKN